jgi:hypothetical protein
MTHRRPRQVRMPGRRRMSQGQRRIGRRPGK